jgi:nucleoporin GLE1
MRAVVNGSSSQNQAGPTALIAGKSASVTPITSSPAPGGQAAPEKQLPFAQSPASHSPQPALLLKSATASNVFGQVTAKLDANGTAVSLQPAQPAVTQSTQQTSDLYVLIHQSLKALRKSLGDQAKVNPALKDRMGDMRREIRKSVGQLTGGAGANRPQVGIRMAMQPGFVCADCHRRWLRSPRC